MKTQHKNVQHLLCLVYAWRLSVQPKQPKTKPLQWITCSKHTKCWIMIKNTTASPAPGVRLALTNAGQATAREVFVPQVSKLVIFSAGKQAFLFCTIDGTEALDNGHWPHTFFYCLIATGSFCAKAGISFQGLKLVLNTWSSSLGYCLLYYKNQA